MVHLNQLIKSNSITTKIVFLLIVLILPLNILSIVSARKAQQVILEQTSSTVDSMLDNSLIFLDTQIAESNHFLYNLIINDPIGTVLTRQAGDAQYLNARYSVASKLQDDMRFQNSADVYFIYSHKLDDMLICKNISFTFSREDLAEQLKAIDLIKEYPKHRIFTFDGQKWLLCAVQYNELVIGSMICVEEMVLNLEHSLSFETDSVMFCSTESHSESSQQMLISSRSQNADVFLEVRIDKKEIISTLPFLQRFGYIMTIIYLLIIPVLLLILNRILLRPLRKITNAMSRLKSGDRNYRIGHHKYSAEFLKINDTFNRMADHIEQLKIEKYESELRREKLKLQNLQLQIRPHFLLNTFNLMYSLSQFDDRENLEDTILYMAEYFRYLFREGQDLGRFEQEYHLIQHYLKIAELRYPNRFTVDYRITDETMLVQIPPLLIHNFVENIIRHALRNQKVVHIILGASVQNGCAKFVIQDDGPGIAPEIMEKINSESLDDLENNTHLGLVNSYQRIKYLLGKDAKLRIDAPDGKGCRITIEFVIENHRREDYHAAVDRK